MNKKAEGYGGYVFLIIILVSFAYFGSNYFENNMYKDLFKQCENYCIQNNQTYCGIQNLKENNTLCVCSENTYPTFRSGLSDFIIADATIQNSSSASPNRLICVKEEFQK